jgi:hypothetical protein
MCSLCGTDWVLKYYLDDLQLQRVEEMMALASGINLLE